MKLYLLLFFGLLNTLFAWTCEVSITNQKTGEKIKGVSSDITIFDNKIEIRLENNSGLLLSVSEGAAVWSLNLVGDSDAADESYGSSFLAGPKKMHHVILDKNQSMKIYSDKKYTSAFSKISYEGIFGILGLKNNEYITVKVSIEATKNEQMNPRANQ